MNVADLKNKRESRNKDIVQRMKTDNLCLFQASLSWFPPRPIIKKDSEAIAQLYGIEQRKSQIIDNTDDKE